MTNQLITIAEAASQKKRLGREIQSIERFLSIRNQRFQAGLGEVPTNQLSKVDQAKKTLRRKKSHRPSSKCNHAANVVAQDRIRGYIQ